MFLILPREHFDKPFPRVIRPATQTSGVVQNTRCNQDPSPTLGTKGSNPKGIPSLSPDVSYPALNSGAKHIIGHLRPLCRIPMNHPVTEPDPPPRNTRNMRTLKRVLFRIPVRVFRVVRGESSCVPPHEPPGYGAKPSTAKHAKHANAEKTPVSEFLFACFASFAVKSFCAAFFNTCCRRAFSACATSGGSLRLAHFDWLSAAAKTRWERIHALLDWKTADGASGPLRPRVASRAKNWVHRTVGATVAERHHEGSRGLQPTEHFVLGGRRGATLENPKRFQPSLRDEPI